MSLNSIILIIVSIIWIASENVLSFTNNTSPSEKKYDDATNRIFHLVTLASIFCGVVIGIKGIGEIKIWHPYLSYLGIALIIIGIVFRRVAVNVLKRYFSVTLGILDGHEIVKTGMYAYIRHPAYTGTLISDIGLGLGLANWLSLIVIFVPLLIVHLHRIGIEEKMLIDHFGEEYIQYMQQTKRLIPKVY